MRKCEVIPTSDFPLPTLKNCEVMKQAAIKQQLPIQIIHFLAKAGTELCQLIIL